MDRSIINPMEQMRAFDYVQGTHDVLLGLGGLAQDVTSGLVASVVGGLVASQTPAASLSITISAGRIYQIAPADALGVGAIPADSSVICQQGYAAAQTITFTTPSSGQSQWNLVQAQFSQQDAVRDNDPNSGIVPFYNVANPTQPTTQSVNTVRKALCVLQVISGSAATTGTEVPPTPTAGWVPLYLIDVAGGQTQITTSQILRAGPSVGTNVPNSYPYAPFLAGFQAPHHSGNAGQAPKINLATEVQGILPYVNMSPVRTLLTAPLTLYVNAASGNDNNQGLTPSAPFLTIQAAISAVFTNYDFNNFGCSISVAPGTYGGGTPTNGYVASIGATPLGLNGSLNIIGNPSNPASVVLNATNANCFGVGPGANVFVNGLTISATGTVNNFVTNSGCGLNANGGYITFQNIIFGTCGVVQVHCGAGGSVVVLLSGITFTGATNNSVVCDTGFIWMPGQVFNVSGLGMTGGGSFVVASEAGAIVAVGASFVGSATGQRYASNSNGIISTGGGGANFFPGSTPGATSTGGLYL